MNNSILAHQQLIKGGHLTAQQEDILSLFGKRSILSTYEIKKGTNISTINTVGARCSELASSGILIGVGAAKHNGRYYTTYRLANDQKERDLHAANHQKASRIRPLQRVIELDYSQSLKNAASLEIDRISQAV